MVWEGQGGEGGGVEGLEEDKEGRWGCEGGDSSWDGVLGRGNN